MTLIQGQYSYRGLTFGKSTDYPLAGPIVGLEGFTVRNGDRPVPRGHGDVPGKHFQTGRDMVATFVLADDTLSTIEDQLAELREVFASDEDDSDDLVWHEYGQPERFVRCRPVSLARGDQGTTGRSAMPKVAFTAADPRIYSTTLRTVTVPLYAASGGGLDFALEFPINFAAGVALDAVAHNGGKADAYPVVRFYGPASGTMTSVTLTNLTTGEAVTVATTITTGQILTVDFGALVTASGEMVVSLDGASRYGSWTKPRLPLRLPPGDSTLRFTIAGTATTASAVVTWRNTWKN